jgi:hypothetical protein
VEERDWYRLGIPAFASPKASIGPSKRIVQVFVHLEDCNWIIKYVGFTGID